jgi:hypothetical protein
VGIKNQIKKLLKDKGRIKNFSSKTLWVIESTTNHPHGPPIAHKLKRNHKSPNEIDSDGFKRIDKKPIGGHNAGGKYMITQRLKYMIKEMT